MVPGTTQPDACPVAVSEDGDLRGWTWAGLPGLQPELRAYRRIGAGPRCF